MRLRRAMSVAMVSTVVSVLEPAAGAAQPPKETSYVALGDSFTAGPLIPQQGGEPFGCLRSDRNFASLVAVARPGTRLTDVSCSAARTEHMFQPQITVIGTNPPQINALEPDTALVTLSIGGNDIGFGEILNVCGVESLKNPQGSGCAAKYGDTLSRRTRATAPRVAAVLTAVRTRAPKARIVVVGYLRLLDEGPGCWPAVPFAAGDAPFFDAAERELNSMVAEQARAHGAMYVDTYKGGGGHDMCAPPEQRWAEGLFPAAPAAPIHPNAAGMREVATRVLAALR